MPDNTIEQRARLPIVMAVALLCAVVALVAISRFSERDLVGQPEQTEILAERIIFLDGDLNGAARVTAENGDVIAEFGPGEAVFISTIARVIDRERATHNADAKGPVHLRKRAPNKLVLFDPATGDETELSGFGKDNIAAFQRLLE
jgi:putative photosynthetic complex assembly protein